MDIDEAMEFIRGASWRGSKLGLERVAELARRIGDPQDKLHFVHVAGTNGKGSTCAMLASILRAAGYHTGLYTSPFIRRFGERMSIDGQDIADDEIARLCKELRPHVEAMDAQPTEFELITAMAFRYFLEHGCDIVVLEVGLGGRMDATNIIKQPESAVITRIGLDHTEVLGGTIAQIAAEKAGIIKAGSPAVSAAQDEAALGVIKERCEMLGSELTAVREGAVRSLTHDLGGQAFSYGDWENVELGLLGGYQLENAATVLETVAVLRREGWNIPDSAVRGGLKEARWPGRFEVLRPSPLFLIDGAHNPNGAKALAGCLAEYLPGKKVTFLMGVMADKDHRGIISILAPFAERFVTVTPRNARALPAQELCREIESFGIEAVSAGEVEDGVALAGELAGPEGVVCAAGSLYMSGDVRACLGKYDVK